MREEKLPNLPPEPVGAVGGAAIQALGGRRRGVGAYSRSDRRQPHIARGAAHQRDSLLQERIGGRRLGHDGQRVEETETRGAAREKGGRRNIAVVGVEELRDAMEQRAGREATGCTSKRVAGSRGGGPCWDGREGGLARLCLCKIAWLPQIPNKLKLRADTSSLVRFQGANSTPTLRNCSAQHNLELAGQAATLNPLLACSLLPTCCLWFVASHVLSCYPGATGCQTAQTTHKR